MAGNDRVTVTFWNAHIMWKNFKGEEREFNKEGDRNFAILLDEEQAEEMLAQRWNVKPMKRRDPDEPQMFSLKVAVNFKYRAPMIYLGSNIDHETGMGRNKSMLTEGLVEVLDRLEAGRVDLTIVAYDWRLKNGAEGRKAYLQTLYFNMYEDDLMRAYAEVQEVPVLGGDVQLALEDGSVIEGEVEED